MTRNQPEGQGQYGYGYGGPQYGENQSYGNYPQQQQGDYNYPPQQQQQGGYGGPNEGSAQGYYGSNNEPYQQYPNDRPPQHHQQGYDQGGYQSQQYGQPYGEPQHSYSSPPPGPPPQQHGYGQEYAPHYMQQPSAEVDNFRSQFDHPNAPPNQYGQYSQAPQGQYTQAPGQYPPSGAPPGFDADRGIMGALAGGAAGAFGGHKMGHGVLGGLGGAVAGSMLEDAYKKHNKKEKKHKKPRSRRGSNSSSSSSSSDSDSDHKKHHGGVPAGNFHASSRNVYLEGHCTLIAECADPHGHHHRSALDLNDCMTNTNGSLFWARGGNFAASARNIRLKHDGRVLEAELGDGSGGWRHNEIDLNERITNDNGRLHML